MLSDEQHNTRTAAVATERPLHSHLMKGACTIVLAGPTPWDW